jgi:hypothetical protein
LKWFLIYGKAVLSRACAVLHLSLSLSGCHDTEPRLSVDEDIQR